MTRSLRHGFTGTICCTGASGARDSRHTWAEREPGRERMGDRCRLWGENPHDSERHPRHGGRGSTFRSCRNGNLVPRPEDLGRCILTERGVSEIWYCGRILLLETALCGIFAYYPAIGGWFVAFRRKYLMEFSDTLDGQGGDSAKAAETFLPLIPTNQRKAKWTLICKKFPSLPTKPHKPE